MESSKIEIDSRSDFTIELLWVNLHGLRSDVIFGAQAVLE